MPTGQRTDPYPAFNFKLAIDGVGTSGFSECTGATSEQEVIEYRDGEDKDAAVVKIPGLNKFGDITLRRGYTKDRNLWNWRKDLMTGEIKRRNGTIELQDEKHQMVLRWKFENALPTNLKIPDFNSKNNEIAIEELVLSVEKLTLE